MLRSDGLIFGPVEYHPTIRSFVFTFHGPDTSNDTQRIWVVEKHPWQFANKQRLLEHRKHLFMVVVIQEPHLCRFHPHISACCDTRKSLQNPSRHNAKMLLLTSSYILHNLGTAVPLRIILAGRFNRTKTIRPLLQALSETHSKTQRFSKVNESIYTAMIILCHRILWTYTAISNPSTPADLEDPLRKELRSNWWCEGWSRTPGFHVIPAMSLLRFFITNASPNRVPTTRLVVPLATWLQSCDVKY